MRGIRKIFLVSFVLLIAISGCAKESEEMLAETSPQVTEEIHVDEDLLVAGVEETDICNENEVEAILSSMSMEEKIEQMMMPAIQSWTESDGLSVPFTHMNEQARLLLEEFQFGGVILFQSNIQENYQTKELTEAISATSKKTGIFIGVDQEGGFITRLTNGCDGPGNMAIAASGDKETAFQEAFLISSELNALGFNVNFAPDMDINTNPANPIIGVRAFSDDGETAGVYALQYQKGMAENGIIPCGKHFPGHGDTSTDSHTGLPVVEKTRSEILQNELIPFQRAIEKGLPMMMTAHIQYPYIEQEVYTSVYDGTEVTLPATLSKTIVTGLLRDELGFEGVVITDSLQMGAIVDHFLPLDAARLAINAGVDILLMPVTISCYEDREVLRWYIDGILEMVNNGEIDAKRIDESCRRILSLKNQYGLLKRNPDSRYPVEQVGSLANHTLEREIADRCVTILENRNQILPIAETAGKTFLLCAPDETLLNAMTYQFELLRREGKIDAGATYQAVDYMYGENGAEMYGLISSSDYVIICSDNYSGYDLNIYYSGNIASVGYAMDLCAEYGIPSIVISTNLPYDVAVLKEADGLLTVYGNGGMELANGVPQGHYGPNVPAALDIIFGHRSPKGKLPLDIPVFAEGWFQEEIQYRRGTGITW